ncbi:hypothetical protein, partial [Streptomyces sp. NPDC018347]|uniref:hypothetical protein n=1 Tax=Streptomyces sp. NPDC018347 TaxID=3157193 RepID=UPI0033D1E920
RPLRVSYVSDTVAPPGQMFDRGGRDWLGGRRAVEDDPEDTKVLKRRLPADAPDHDRSDDPVTGAPSIGGDAFDKDGNPIPLEQLVNLEDIECYDDLHDGDFEDEPVPDWATDLARRKESEKRRKDARQTKIEGGGGA